ncbi:nucleoside diphosphate kinase 2, chloroplastic-like [Telopea speciosissima]|uniref:nucleoside diphosphate kinase 2, chloroplastic-like n=1 Tax=Telopea speciosissima TaxID=54955 RepID=UPI001CC7DE25|nr:nucleoside diphosphate kinase 2, chloroplastic-like [Telopea speciosissima]
MEALAVFGGSPCVSTSSLQSASATTKRSGSLSCTHNLTLRTRHLSAFHGSPSLFLCSPTLSHAKRRARKIRPNIFLPHLIDSMEDVEETTYITVKPDGVQRGLVGEIISRFEKKGSKLTGLKPFQCPKELAEEHYKDLQAKPFFPKLIQCITSDPVVCMAWEGVGVVGSARKLIGATNPLQAEPGTIR